MMRKYLFEGTSTGDGSTVLGGITYVGDTPYITIGIRSFIEVVPESVRLLPDTDTTDVDK